MTDWLQLQTYGEEILRFIFTRKYLKKLFRVELLRHLLRHTHPDTGSYGIVQFLDSFESFNVDPDANWDSAKDIFNTDWGYEDNQCSDDWQSHETRLKYKLLYCFAPHGVK